MVRITTTLQLGFKYFFFHIVSCKILIRGGEKIKIKIHSQQHLFQHWLIYFLSYFFFCPIYLLAKSNNRSLRVHFERLLWHSCFSCLLFLQIWSDWQLREDHQGLLPHPPGLPPAHPPGAAAPGRAWLWRAQEPHAGGGHHQGQAKAHLRPVLRHLEGHFGVQ